MTIFTRHFTRNGSIEEGIVYCYAEVAVVSFLVVAVTIASTLRAAYPRRNGQAEW